MDPVVLQTFSYKKYSLSIFIQDISGEHLLKNIIIIKKIM